MNIVESFLADEDAMAHPLAKDLGKTAAGLMKLTTDDLNSLFGALLMVLVDREVLLPLPAAEIAKIVRETGREGTPPHA